VEPGDLIADLLPTSAMPAHGRPATNRPSCHTATTRSRRVASSNGSPSTTASADQAHVAEHDLGVAVHQAGQQEAPGRVDGLIAVQRRADFHDAAVPR
jgi:hypothetical protein